MLTYFRCVGGHIERKDEFTPESLKDAPEGTLHWIDLEDPTIKESSILEDPFHFHPLAIEDTLAEVHHPKLDDYDAYIYLIVHGMRFDAPTDQFITRELDVFLGPNYLVTHHNGPMRSISSIRDQCGKDIENAFPKGCDFLLHHILDQMFDHYFPSLDALEDKIQLIQVEVFESPTRDTLDRIFTLKKDIMQLRRLCLPQREIVSRLSRADVKVISPRAGVYFRDIYDNLYRIVEASFSYQDIVQSLLDAYLSAVSNRLNETMKRLTVFGAIFAALTVITGIYGMNFENMPELRWKYGYLMVWLIMASAIGGLLAWFKKKEWI
jgi:magnesium transporter